MRSIYIVIIAVFIASFVNYSLGVICSFEFNPNNWAIYNDNFDTVEGGLGLVLFIFIWIMNFIIFINILNEEY